MKHVLCVLVGWLIGLGSLLLANNIAVSNANAAGQNTSAGLNNHENSRLVQCDVPWTNRWRWNSSSRRNTCFGVKTGGTGCGSAPNASMGAGGGFGPKADADNTRQFASAYLTHSARATANRFFGLCPGLHNQTFYNNELKQIQ